MSAQQGPSSHELSAPMARAALGDGRSWLHKDSRDLAENLFAALCRDKASPVPGSVASDCDDGEDQEIHAQQLTMVLSVVNSFADSHDGCLPHEEKYTEGVLQDSCGLPHVDRPVPRDEFLATMRRVCSRVGRRVFDTAMRTQIRNGAVFDATRPHTSGVHAGARAGLDSAAEDSRLGSKQRPPVPPLGASLEEAMRPMQHAFTCPAHAAFGSAPLSSRRGLFGRQVSDGGLLRLSVIEQDPCLDPRLAFYSTDDSPGPCELERSFSTGPGQRRFAKCNRLRLPRSAPQTPVWVSRHAVVSSWHQVVIPENRAAGEKGTDEEVGAAISALEVLAGQTSDSPRLAEERPPTIPETSCMSVANADVDMDDVVEKLLRPRSAGGSSTPQPMDESSNSEEAAPPALERRYCCEPDDNVIIFDWDDTLCPTSFMHEDPRLAWSREAPCFTDPSVPLYDPSDRSESQNAAEYTAEASLLMAEALHRHVEAASAALRSAAACGRVVIVTLAKPGWVEVSSKNFLPGLLDVIKDLSIEVVYARDSLQTWKLRCAARDDLDVLQLMKQTAMSYAICRHYKTRPCEDWLNVVGIGDAEVDRGALIEAVLCSSPQQWVSSTVTSSADESGRGVSPPCRCKTLKLPDDPGLLQLTAQLEVLTAWIHAVTAYDGDIDIDFSSAENCLALMQQMEKGLHEGSKEALLPLLAGPSDDSTDISSGDDLPR